MANFNDIKHEIDQNVNTNGVQAITGAILNETLKDMIDEVDAKKQDTLVAGQNITIQGNVISATGGGSGETYTEGHGIDISVDNEISVDTQELAGYGLNNTDYQFNVDTSVIQEKLTAGANIQINGDTISATDTTYSAGSGLSLNGTTFSVDSSSLAGSGLEVDEFGALKTDPSVVQSKLTAGDGIEIDGSNEISVKAGSGLGFDANGYLINTGGGGGGTTYTAGDGIEIDSNDAINAKLGNGLQLDQNNNIEIDPSVVATQNDLAGKQDTLTAGNGIDISAQDVISVDPNDLAGNGLAVNQSGYLEPDFTVVASQSDLSSYLRNDASGTVQNFLDGTGDTELTVMDGMSEDYVRFGAYETQGEQPHIEIFENGSGDTKFFYDHIERGSQVSIDLPSSSGTLALTSDIPTVPTASSLAGNGLQDDGNGALEIDTTVVATQNDLSDYLPLTGGTLNNTGQINTNLSVQSPNSDYHVNTYVPNSGSVEIEIGMSSGHAVQNPSDGDTKNLRVYKDKVDLYTYDSNTSNWRTDSLYFPKKKTGTIALDSDLAGKQDTLVSGTNIKTINGNSLLGSGDLTISGGQSYTAGHGVDITSGTISVDATDLDGSGLTTNASGELEVDTSLIQTKLTAGSGITINGSTISATDTNTTYSAGTGLSLNGTTFSVNTNTIQEKLTAGQNITISGNVISATGGSGATYSAGDGINIDQNNEISVDASDLAGSGLMVDQNGALAVIGGGGSGLWVSDRGVDSLLSPGAHSNSISYASGQGAINAGNYSQADSQGGWISAAIGDFSTTFGTNTSATGDNSAAFGFKTKAEGDNSFVMGTTNSASGDNAFAGGSNASAFADNTFAFNGDALGQGSVAIGIGSEANGMNSVAIGSGARTDSMYAIALGTNSSAVAHSTAVGYNVSTGNAYETATGEFNKTYASSTYSSDSDKTHFSIGNGTDGNNRSNAFEIKKNNDAYLVGVGNYDGTNAGQAGVSTLQAVINSGGQGTVYSSGQGIDITSNVISVEPDLTLESLTVKNDTNSNLTTVSCSSPNTTGNIRSVNINVSKDVSGAPGKSNINLQSDGNYASAGDTYSVGLNNNGSISVSYKNSGNQSQVATINYPQKSGTIALLSDISGSGTQYTAGSGISISAQNVISNSAPDPGFWVAGETLGSLKDSRVSVTCKGADATAIGPLSTVNGYQSTAIAGGQVGNISNARSVCTAVGYGAYCNANYTTAFGIGTRAFNQYESSVGTYANSITGGTNAENTQFTIGNGSSNASRSNLLEAKQNNDIYVIGVGGFDGTNAGSAGVHTLQYAIANAGGGGGSSLWVSGTGTDSLVAPATITAGLAVDPAQGTGAISCGYDTNANGDYSFASGAGSTAGGDYSFAANNGTAAGDYSAAFNTSGADGDYSFAAGYGSVASAQSSIALAGGITNYDDSDPQNIINAEGSVAIGNGAGTSGYQSIAIGSSASTSEAAIDGIAIGVAAYANAQEAVAIGSSSTAEGLGTVALSSGTASGEYSTAMSSGDAIGSYSVAGGLDAIAGAYSSVALGFNTMTYDQGDPTDPSEANAGEAAFGRYNYTEQDFIFTVGCGQEIYHDPDDPDFQPNPDDPDSPDGWYEIVRQNAITITSDGNIYIKGAGGYLGQGITGADSLQTLLYNLNPQ